MPELKQTLDRWATQHGLRFVWVPEHTIPYSGSRGAWHLSTAAVNGNDDWISVHPGPPIELALVADVGHVEVERVTVDQLAVRLEGVLDWFEGWTRFFQGGPGLGH